MSARMVKKALEQNRHNVILFDFKKGLVELKKILEDFDVVFPVMHGKEGEDGKLYKLLRSAKKRYVGSDPKGATIAFNKIAFKKYCNKKHLPTADWKIVKSTKDISAAGFPCVLKAAEGGSSHEVVVLRSAKDLNKSQAKKILALKSKLFVEALLEGIEITVGVLLGKALPVVEIVPPPGRWFDYKNKYSGGTREFPFAPSITKHMQRRVQEMALRIHANLRLGSFSRLDIIVENNTPYILEVNTPGGVGLTPKSLFPKAAKAAGISFNELVEKMLV